MNKIRLQPLPAALRLQRWSATLAALAAPGLALANPSGADVVAGQVGLATPNANTLVVNQASQNAIINWQQFSVGGNEFVVFNQPNASAAVLNRVVGGLPSEVLGNLSANGRVFLINPQGVMFGQGARVDVGSLVASTMNIADQDFLAGKYALSQGQARPGSVINQGTINAADGGFVVLSGDKVSNSGLIAARLGDVVLASGSAMTLDLDGNGLVGFSVDSAALGSAAGVENLGQIVADGGMVVLTAKVARDLIGNAVNNQGRITAHSIQEHAGAIYLTAEGGDVTQAGVLDASGMNGAEGGTIRLLSDRDVTLTATSQTLASGAGGGDVRAIADGTLTYARGARIDVAATSLTGRRGFAELSGHDRVRISDIVNVGRGGRLLIDPAILRIGDPGCVNAGTCDIEQTTIESQLVNGGESSFVDLVATDSITVQNLADNLIDGTNPSPGLGASLRLRIGVIGSDSIGSTFFPDPDGSITFDDIDDFIRVDGDLVLESGQTTGDVVTGGLVSNNGDVSVVAAGLASIRNNNDFAGNIEAITAGRRVTIRGATVISQQITADTVFVSSGGDTTLALVQADTDVEISGFGSGLMRIQQVQAGLSGFGDADLSQSTGDIETGNIATSHGSIFVRAFEGDITVGNLALLDAPGTDGHQIRLNAAGAVTAGDLDATAIAALGNANLLISVTGGGSIQLGDVNMVVDITTGEIDNDLLAEFLVRGSGGTVTVGDVNVSAHLGTRVGTFQDNEAYIDIDNSAGSVTTGALSAIATAGVSDFAYSSIDVSATGGDVTVAGASATTTVTGANGSGSAEVFLRATGGDVRVNGDVTGTTTLADGRYGAVYMGLYSQNTGSVTVTGNIIATSNVNNGSSAYSSIDLSVDAGIITVDGLTAAIAVVTNGSSGANASGSVFIDGGISGSVEMADVVATATLQNQGRSAFADVEVDTQAGNITLGDVTASATIGENPAEFSPDIEAYIFLSANGGSIDAGDLLAAVNAGSEVEGSAFVGVDVVAGASIDAGDVSATAFNAATEGGPVLDGTAQLVLEAQDGDLRTGSLEAGGDISTASVGVDQSGAGVLLVSGTIDVNARGSATSFSSYGGTEFFQESGAAVLAVFGLDITVTDAIDVRGLGLAQASFVTGVLPGGSSGAAFQEGPKVGEEGNITLSGPVNVQATVATTSSTNPAGNSELERHGAAQFFALTGGSNASRGSVQTGDVTVTGPTALAFVSGARVLMTDSNGDGVSLNVSAAAGGPAGDGAYYRRIGDGQTVAESTYGSAQAFVQGTGGGPSDPSVVTNGGISVTGPTAGLNISSLFGVVIGNETLTQPANLVVDALGYVVDAGDFLLIPSDHRPNSGSVPPLASGRLEWGEANLHIGGIFESSQGPSDAPPAGAVLVFGNIDVDGQGRALARIDAESLDMDGVGGAGGDISVSASLGLVEGTTLATAETIGGNSYAVTRQISDGQSGPARWSEASFQFEGAEGAGNVELRSLNASGGRAGADFSTSGTITIRGDARVLGGVGQEAPVYHEVASFVPIQGGTPLADSTTHIVGDLSFFSTGLAGDQDAADLTVGGLLEIEGTGLVAAVLRAGTVQLNDLQMEALQGEYTTNDPRYVPTAGGFGDAVLLVETFAPGSVVTGDNIDVGAASAAHIGGAFALTGDFTVQQGAGGQVPSIDQVLPGNGLGYSAPMLGNDMTLGVPDVQLATLDVQAQDITLRFSGQAALPDADFTAAGVITIFGGGSESTLSAGDVDWTAGSVDIQQVSIDAGTMSLVTTGALSVSNISELHYTAGTLTAGGALTLSDALVQGNTHSLAGGTLTLDDAEVQGSTGGAASSIGLSAGADMVLNNASLRGSTLALSAARDLTLVGSLLGNLVATAGRNLSIAGSSFNGGTGIFSTTGAGAITIDNSSFDYTNSLRITSAGSLLITGSDLGAEAVVKAAGDPDIDLTAALDLALVGNSRVVGDRVRLLSTGGSIELQASIDATHLLVDAAGQVRSTVSGSSRIEVGALDVIGSSITLDRALITVGNGLAEGGRDPQLVSGLPSALQPRSNGPNAALVARNGTVQVQDLFVGGGYLFVKANGFSGVVGSSGPLFINLRPSSDTGNLDVRFLDGIEPTVPTTFAFGGTGFEGDVVAFDMANPSEVLVGGETNLVFLTDANIVGLSHISTGGQVIVLRGTAVEPGAREPDTIIDSAIGAVSDLSGEPPQDDENPKLDDPDFLAPGDGSEFINDPGDSPSDQQCT